MSTFGAVVVTQDSISSNWQWPYYCFLYVNFLPILNVAFNLRNIFLDCTYQFNLENFGLGQMAHGLGPKAAIEGSFFCSNNSEMY